MKTWPLVLFLLLVGCSNAPSPKAASVISPGSLTPLAAQAATSSLPPGKVQAFYVTGDVQLKQADGTRRPLARGSSFQEGTTIISGADGNALVVFSNGASIKIVPNTELEIAKFEQAAFDEKIEGSFMRLTRDPSKSTTLLKLHKGSWQGEVKKLNVAAGSTFIIDTPTGLIDLSKPLTSISVEAKKGVSIGFTGSNVDSSMDLDATQITAINDAINLARANDGLSPQTITN